MAILNKTDILAAQDLPIETVAVPEWGGDVIVRCMSGLERDAFEESTRKNRSNMATRLLAFTLVDEAGQHLFSEEEMVELGKKSGAVINRLFAVSIRLNGLGDEQKAAAEKN